MTFSNGKGLDGLRIHIFPSRTSYRNYTFDWFGLSIEDIDPTYGVFCYKETDLEGLGPWSIDLWWGCLLSDGFNKSDWSEFDKWDGTERKRYL